MRMQEGTTKLLAACKHRIQYLEAAKSLLTSNERVATYLAEIEKIKTCEKSMEGSTHSSKVQQCSKAKVSISDIRIPLIWKDSDHFKNRGDCRRFAVFCLIKIGTELYDTALISDVDRNVTDVTFDDVIIFSNISPDFELHLELYSHILFDDFSIASVPCKLKRKFTNSLGRTLGRKLAATLKDELRSSDIYPKFDLIAQTTLRLSDASDSIQTHDLLVGNLRNNHHALPLFSHFCCRLAVQLQHSREDISGYITLIQNNDDVGSKRRMWCVFSNSKLSFWRKSEDYYMSCPLLIISIGKNVLLELQNRQLLSFSIEDSSILQRYILVTDSDSDYVKWTTHLVKYIEDHKQWGNIMDSIMDIPSSLPSWLSSFFYERQGSLYEEIAIKDMPVSSNSRISLHNDDADLSSQSFRFRSCSLSNSIPNRNYQSSFMHIRKPSINTMFH